jgi:hypothetical protein
MPRKGAHLFVAVLTLALMVSVRPAQTHGGLWQSDAAHMLAVAARGTPSLPFIENRGQIAEEAVRYYLPGADRMIYLAEDALWVTLHPPIQVEGAPEQTTVTLKLSFPNANPHPVLQPFGRLATSVHYFLGNDAAQWRTNVPVYAGVRYIGLYPGIDLEIGSAEGRWIQRLVVHPGADLNAVRLRVEGAEEVTPTAQGMLCVRTAAGVYRLPLWSPVTAEGVPLGDVPDVPQVFPVSTGVRAYEVVHPFAPATTPPTAAAQDAPDLRYATLLRGSDDDWGLGIAVDAQGAVYVTGLTASPDFPATPGVLEGRHQGGRDAFVAKLDVRASTLEYATFLGGSKKDWGSAIAVDADGAAYVTGRTESPDFPTTPAAFGRSYQGGWDVFIAKLTPDGANLVYATFLGGSRYDRSFAIAVDATGAAYVTGPTYSPDFPITPGAFDSVIGEGICEGEACLDAFVAKVNPQGSALMYATFLGGSDYDYGSAVVVDDDAAVYVAGETRSPDFPTTQGAFDRELDGPSDAFIARLNPQGSTLTYATFLGGSGWEGGFALARDAASALYVAGPTYSADFPTTRGAFKVRYGGAGDAFVAKLRPDGTALAYATLLGGSDYDYASGVAVDAAGAVYITGRTWSADFPTTDEAFDGQLDGPSDAFIARLDARGAALEYATFLGGSGYDYASGIAIGADGAAYVTGLTASRDFPTTRGAFDDVIGAGACAKEPCLDAFVAKLAW